MAVTFIATGADVVSDAETNFDTNGGGGDGDLTLTGGEKVFDDAAIIEFTAIRENNDGELRGGSGFTNIKVYASRADYEAGIVQYEYVPQNPNQTGNVQGDGSGVGDGYIAFNNVFVSSSPGAPTLDGRVFVAPGSGAANQIGTYTSRREEDFDFNNDGDFDDPLEMGNGLFAPQISALICFTPGTVIATARGEVLVEDLSEGDKVFTRDNGLQPIRWVGARSVTRQELARQPQLQPILIRAGALGSGLPLTDLIVSPNHRVLITSATAQMYFEENEVLVAAKHLVGRPGVARLATQGTTYVHFMCDAHEVVLSNGAWTESFQPGSYTLDAMEDAARQEILDLFPELRSHAGLAGYTAARRALKRHEAALLVGG